MPSIRSDSGLVRAVCSPHDDLLGAVLPGSGGRIRTYDLWVMRRMAPVPRIPSDPGMSYLAGDDRLSRPRPSSLFDRFPQRPYYRFYYAAVTSDVSGADRHVGEAPDLGSVSS
jgi:hypothetical protein